MRIIEMEGTLEGPKFQISKRSQMIISNNKQFISYRGTVVSFGNCADLTTLVRSVLRVKNFSVSSYPW